MAAVMTCVNNTDCNGHGVCGVDSTNPAIMTCLCEYGWYEEVNCSLNPFSNRPATFYTAPFNLLMMLTVFLFYSYEIYGNLRYNHHGKSIIFTPLHYAKWGGLLFAVTRIIDEVASVYMVKIGYAPRTFDLAVRVIYYLGFLFAISADVCIFLVWTEVAQKVKKVNNEYQKHLVRITLACWISFAIISVLLLALTAWTAIDPGFDLLHLSIAVLLGAYVFAIAVAGIVYTRRVSIVLKERDVLSRASQRFLYKNFLFTLTCISFIVFFFQATLYNVIRLFVTRETPGRPTIVVLFNVTFLVNQFLIYIFVYFMVEQRSPFRTAVFVRALQWLGVQGILSASSMTEGGTTAVTGSRSLRSTNSHRTSTSPSGGDTGRGTHSKVSSDAIGAGVGAGEAAGAGVGGLGPQSGEGERLSLRLSRSQGGTPSSTSSEASSDVTKSIRSSGGSRVLESDNSSDTSSSSETSQNSPSFHSSSGLQSSSGIGSASVSVVLL